MPSAEQRFRELYTACSGPIMAYALRRTPNSHDAADVVAETFAIAWRRIDDVPRGDRSRLWLYGVARRVLANQRRSEQRRQSLTQRLRQDLPLLDEVVEGQVNPAQDDEHARIATAFARLVEADQELLALVGWERLSRSQIATILGCSRAAVRVRLHRARRRFAVELEAEEAGQPSPRDRQKACLTTGPHRSKEQS